LSRKQVNRSRAARRARALKIKPPFDRFYFIDLDKDKTAHLQKQCEGRTDVRIINDDANVYLRTLLPTIQYRKCNRALCVLDPHGLHFDWEVQLAGQSEAVDLFLNFPVMDMNRNASGARLSVRHLKASNT
jgi:three-Cys-motif partner protein